jgi:signal transduction histidine kinase
MQMEPRPGFDSLDEMPTGVPGTAGPPFQGPGLLARAGPFALVALAAEASLALPPGPDGWVGVVVSLVLLAATGLAFLLPWDRLPGWTPVLVPLAYTGSVLALTLAAGPTSGVGIVLLVPLIWTALFHRRWESACVLTAIIAALMVISTDQSSPAGVDVRRALLWGALGALLAVATHGLRDRIRRSQQETARLQQRVGELMVVRDRDRLAADLQGSVVQRLFAAGLSLQSVLSMVSQAEVRRRVESSVTDLDDAIRQLRHAIFDLETRTDVQGLRQQVLHVCADMSPMPEITFTGPVDEALPAEAADQVVGLLRLALGLVGDEQTVICVEAGQSLSVAVTGTGPAPRPVNGHGTASDFAPLREQASHDGIAIEIEPVDGGTRLAWSLPLGSGV